MDQCGEASAAAKLSSLSLQDRSLFSAKTRQKQTENGGKGESAEYFEFAVEGLEANWAKEFQNQPPVDFHKGFENAFLRAKTAATVSGANIPSEWITHFKQQQQQMAPHPISSNEFDQFSQIFNSIGDRASWEKEFSKYELSPSNSMASAWKEEFGNEKLSESEKVENEEDTAQSARILLESLDLSDPKLSASKFVAYLRELTESDPTINGTFEQVDYNWVEQFHKSMEAAGLVGAAEDDQWANLEKAWDRHTFSGIGYENFAPREFAQYRYSLEDALNPFHGMGSESIRHQLPELKGRNLRKYILALEEITRLRPDDAVNWMHLGAAQSENELDVQAIAAYYRATQIDPKLNAAWLGLAAACVNECCVPDALEAFKRIALNCNEGAISFDANDSSSVLSKLVAIFRNQSLIGDEAIRVGALAVLLNVTGELDEAISLLQNSSISLSNDYTIWNRLGATLANSKRYEDAQMAYTQALNLNPTFVRALYNMGVSYMNQSNYPKALGYMIRAVQYHLPVETAIDASNISDALKTGYDTIWNTMRIVGDMWGRDDINILIEERNTPAIMNLLKEVL